MQILETHKIIIIQIRAKKVYVQYTYVYLKQHTTSTHKGQCNEYNANMKTLVAE